MRTTPEGKYVVGSIGRRSFEPVIETYSEEIENIAEFVTTLPAEIDVQIRRYHGIGGEAGWIVWAMDTAYVRHSAINFRTMQLAKQICKHCGIYRVQDDGFLEDASSCIEAAHEWTDISRNLG